MKSRFLLMIIWLCCFSLALSAQSLSFCKSVDNSGIASGTSSYFTIDDGESIIALVKSSYVLDANELNYVVYEINSAGNEVYSTIISQDIKPDWTYAWKGILFYESGSYKIYVRDDMGNTICSASLTVNVRSASKTSNSARLLFASSIQSDGTPNGESSYFYVESGESISMEVSSETALGLSSVTYKAYEVKSDGSEVFLNSVSQSVQSDWAIFWHPFNLSASGKYKVYVYDQSGNFLCSNSFTASVSSASTSTTLADHADLTFAYSTDDNCEADYTYTTLTINPGATISVIVDGNGYFGTEKLKFQYLYLNGDKQTDEGSDEFTIGNDWESGCVEVKLAAGYWTIKVFTLEGKYLGMGNVTILNK